MDDIKNSCRPLYHIQPPQGWLNDPNGIIWYKDRYHVWFQYAPDSPSGSGRKCWGHYSSADLINFQFEGISIEPDCKYDRDGAYSGNSFVSERGLEIYYTGNVKRPGNFDYINEGRGHNVLRVLTEDGENFEKKEIILTNDDYPEDLSCHVRDPRLFYENGMFYMLLGARRRDSKGGLLIMKSKDRDDWSIDREIFPDGFGYMLECPDYFNLRGENVLSFCPQGMEASGRTCQNIYNSGYIILGNDSLSTSTDSELLMDIKRPEFREWDMGFDFYAPETMLTPDGRRILIGWAGVPDAPYGNDLAVKEGWQHTLTVPRELSLRNNIILQQPVRELQMAHGRRIRWSSDNTFIDSLCFDMTIIAGGQKDFRLKFNDDLEFCVEDSVASLRFISNGFGRDLREAELKEPGNFRNLRILFDRSMIEFYLNDGETVFTTRYYPDKMDGVNVSVKEDCRAECFEMMKTVSF